MLPDEVLKATCLVLHDVEPDLSAPNSSANLCLAANDGLIAKQSRHVLLPITGDFLRLKVLERAAEVLPLAQDRYPGEARLESVKNEFLVKRAIVELRHAPLFVVIGDIERID